MLRDASLAECHECKTQRGRKWGFIHREHNTAGAASNRSLVGIDKSRTMQRYSHWVWDRHIAELASCIAI